MIKTRLHLSDPWVMTRGSRRRVVVVVHVGFLETVVVIVVSVTK